jgi:hypothetical protein
VYLAAPFPDGRNYALHKDQRARQKVYDNAMIFPGSFVLVRQLLKPVYYPRAITCGFDNTGFWLFYYHNGSENVHPGNPLVPRMWSYGR